MAVFFHSLISTTSACLSGGIFFPVTILETCRSVHNILTQPIGTSHIYYKKTMKNKIYLILLLSISVSISSCSTDDDINHQNDFENSQEAWLDFKASSNNSYKYVVSSGSILTTFGWETTITVSSGVIIERAFRYTSGAEEFVPVDELEWTENENEINSLEHQQTSAYTALTLDEIYDKAKQEWLIERKNSTSYFESENNGLISTCGYVEKGCMDDCFNGIIVTSIVAL